MIQTLASALSDAGNWAAIVAAAILVAGLIFGWFQRVSHALHIVDERLGLQALDDDEGPGDIGVSVALEVRNTASIPLSYEVARCTAIVVERFLGDEYEDEHDLHHDSERQEISPGQVCDWRSPPISTRSTSFPIIVTVRYEVEYGRKSPRLWRLRRRIIGGFRAEIPMMSTVNDMIVIASDVGGPRRDMRVPLVSRSMRRRR